MGYRSNVVLALCDEADELLQANIKMIPELKELIDDVDSEADGRYHWDYIRWCKSCKQIQAMDRFMGFLDCHDWVYGFVRIGEETDDMETRGYPSDFDVYIERTISW
tara:strand:+ start:5753 stop:6073 length:321 start_codon:yes stop_codon:yes gene_type:complete